jgi:hypothetical protein
MGGWSGLAERSLSVFAPVWVYMLSRVSWKRSRPQTAR